MTRFLFNLLAIIIIYLITSFTCWQIPVDFQDWKQETRLFYVIIIFTIMICINALITYKDDF
jgi:DMSO/TMAO reductase YedYZ heme-binding membrane subunit